MPWSKPNPITGMCKYCPTLKEAQQDALDMYNFLLPDRHVYTYADLAKAIRSYYVAEGDEIGARRNSFFAEALEQDPDRMWMHRLR